MADEHLSEGLGPGQLPPRSLPGSALHYALVARGYAVRGFNRFVARPFRRRRKFTREYLKNTVVAARVQLSRWRRKAQAAPAKAEKRVEVWNDTGKRLRTYTAEWAVEREIRRVVSGQGPIIVGPWLSEVGYEVLYWIPFVRWVQSRYNLKSARLTVVTRGGAAAWYRDITSQSVEVFDLITPEEFAKGNAGRSAETGGSLKQLAETSFDRSVAEAAARRAGLDGAKVLHPSLMYRLFGQFMLGHRSMEFLRRRTRYELVTLPDIPLPALPADYVAVKLYTAASLPDTPAIRRTLQSLVLSLAERWPVVMLDTGLALDDHDDYTFERASRITTIREHLRPSDNLAVQSAVIAHSRAFVGTCGSLAWLAPMLGVETTALLADPRFLHGHLQVGRQMFQSMGGANFSPLDVSALDPLGLTLANAGSRPSGAP